MNSDTAVLVGEMSKWACEVTNGINHEVANVRGAVEAMDSGMVERLDKLQNTVGDGLDTLNEKLEEIHFVLSEIRDLLQDQNKTTKKQKKKK